MNWWRVKFKRLKHRVEKIHMREVLMHMEEEVNTEEQRRKELEKAYKSCVFP